MKTTTVLFLSSLACASTAVVSAWTPASSGSSSSRRTFIDQAVKIVPLVAIASPVFAADDDEAAAAAAAAVSVTSESETVEAAVEAAPVPSDTTATPTYDSNDFIGRLKAQSDANADKYKRDAQRSDKLSKSQFIDQYKKPSYVGVRTSKDSMDASQSTMVLQSELDQLLSQGKVTKSYESKANKKSGEISDDYSKPIWVFVN
jgi:hypothetical protein